MARTTRTTAVTRTEFNALVAAVEALTTVVTASIDPKAPAKARTTRKAPAKKAPARKAPAKKAPVKEQALCKATRKAFVARAAKEGIDFGGMSTQTIAAMCLEDESLIPAGFRVGEGYRALLG